MYKTLEKLVLTLLCTVVTLSGCTPVPTRTNSQDQLDKPYLILISIDGFRWDYIDLFDTPAIDRLVADGVRSQALIPTFPTLTFPNHYTIVSGLHPGHHGIVANNFRDKNTGDWYKYSDPESAGDGKWYGGEPVWVVAENAGMLSASFFFVGTEAEIQGVRPAHWRQFNKSVSGKKRVKETLKWLKLPPEQRPHLYTLYFEDVDDNSHWFGPMSRENEAAVGRVDGYVQQLLDGISRLSYGDQVNIVLVSDHGQMSFSADMTPFVISEHFSLEGIKPIDSGTSVFLYFDDVDRERALNLRDGINQAWDCGQAYLPEDTPAAWQISEGPRTADMYIMAEPGCGVLSSQDRSSKIKIGGHGWAPETPEMNGIFIASGPRLPAGVEIEPVNAVDIYPFLLELLYLEPVADVDSNPDVLTPLISR